jgi:hypothetical protein
MAYGTGSPLDFVKRFERLKQLWFAKRQVEYDEYGDEKYSAIPDRATLAKQFEQMGCDIPLSPKDPPTLIPHVNNSLE